MPDFRVPELSIDSTPVQRHNTSMPTTVHTDISTTSTATKHQDAPTVTMPTTMSATKPGPKPVSTIKRTDTSGYVSKIKPPQTGTMPVIRKNSKPTLDPADKPKTASSVQSVQSVSTDLIDEPLPADPDKALALIISRTNMTDVNSLAKSLVAVLHWMDRFAQMIESMDASGQSNTQTVPTDWTDGITARDIARMLHDKVDMMTERLVGINPDESNKQGDRMRAKMNTIMAERRKADRDNQMMSLLGTLDTIAQQTDAYTDPNLTQVMLEMMQRMNEGR